MNKKLIRVIKPNELDYFEGQRKYLSTSSINENGIEKIECYITYDNRPSRASMKPIKNSVWFAKMKNSIKVFHSTENDEHEYILSTGFYGILSLSSIISPFWLEQIFKSDYFNNQKDKFSEGSSMSGVKDNQFSDLKIKIFKNNTYEQKYTEILNLLDQYVKYFSRILKLLYQEKEYLLSNLFI